MSEQFLDKELHSALKGQLEAWRANNQRDLGKSNDEIVELWALRERASQPLPASDALAVLGRQAVALQSGDRVAPEAVNEQLSDATSRHNRDGFSN